MSLQISVRSDAPGIPLAHYWNFCVGAGRAHEGLRTNWQEHLALAVKECGFRYLRFHGLFHDDMCVYREGNGKPVYNWQYIDELFDRMLAIGIRPFVELGFFPKDIAAPNSKTQFWWKGCITPPASFEKWSALVEQFVRHCLQRYGAAEVREWYFEVWNEPNLGHAFWDGTRTQYFELYRASVNAIKAVDPTLRVGGPATSNFVPDERFDCDREDTSKHVTHTMVDLGEGQWRAPWVEAFLEFCAAEQLPMDFIANHPYPTDFPLDEGGKYVGRTRPVGSTRQDLNWLREIVDASAFPKAEIHLTEWSSSPSPRDHSHDSLPAATYVAKVNAGAHSLVDSLSYWVFTDVFEESGGGDTIFHGGFGLINFQGVVKPTFHAYRFLNLLGDEEIAKGDDFIATRKTGEQAPRVLIWHYPPEMRDTVPLSATPEQAEAIRQIGVPAPLHVEITALPPGQPMMVETLDSENGFALKEWAEMERPEPPDREQIRHLRQKALETRKEILAAGPDGVFRLDREITPWSLVLIRPA